jgi:hypothetical protein
MEAGASINLDLPIELSPLARNPASPRNALRKTAIWLDEPGFAWITLDLPILHQPL